MSEAKTKKAAALLVAVMFAAMVTVNGLANALPLNGVNTGQLSDEIPNLFVPAGITFAIWGVIYLLLLGYAATLLAATFGKGSAGAWEPIDGVIFAFNAAFNAAWIFAWHWRLIPLSFALMIGILVTLLVLMERANRARSAPTDKAGAIRRFFIRVPILVYLGWICVATIANATALLVVIGWKGFGFSPVLWTVAVILVGAGIGSWLVAKRGALSSGLVIVWAYAGIVIKRGGTDQESTMAIIIGSFVGIAAVVVSGLPLLARSMKARGSVAHG